MQTEHGEFTDEFPPDPADTDHARPNPGGISELVSDVRQLIADGRTLAEAELAYQSSRARLAGSAAKAIALHALVAFVFAVFALVALVVGLLLALAPLVTAWGATAIVAGGLLLLAAFCALRARRRWTRASHVLSGAPGKTAPLP